MEWLETCRHARAIKLSAMYMVLCPYIMDRPNASSEESIALSTRTFLERCVNSI